MWLIHKIPGISKYLLYYIDNNKERHGIELCEKPVYGPDYLKTDREKAIILICSMQNSKDISEQIDSMKIDKKYLIVE